jgi:hypothetical protein
MSTPFSTPVSRVSNKEYRTDGGKSRRIVVTLGAADVIELRPLRGKPVTLPVEALYWIAVRASVGTV